MALAVGMRHGQLVPQAPDAIVPAPAAWFDLWWDFR
jgi:hypothetical protein